VVLPQPEGPSREKNSPAKTVSDTSSSATTSSKRRVTFTISMAAGGVIDRSEPKQIGKAQANHTTADANVLTLARVAPQIVPMKLQNVVGTWAVIFSKTVILGAFIGVLSGCYRPEKPKYKSSSQADNKPRPEYYAHCEVCVWCKGPFRNGQEVEKLTREHNIKKHDYERVSYFDTEKCRK